MNKTSLSDKPDPAPKVGQFYQLLVEGSPYNRNVFFLVQDGNDLFSLIDLSDGRPWANPHEEIEDVFGNQKEEFRLITSPFTITPDYN